MPYKIQVTKSKNVQTNISCDRKPTSIPSIAKVLMKESKSVRQLVVICLLLNILIHIYVLAMLCYSEYFLLSNKF